VKRMFLRVVFVSVVRVMAGCSHSAEEKSVEAPAERAAESRVSHGSNGETVITLDAETRKSMGLQTASIAATELTPEVKGFGRIVDPTPLAEMLLELRKAQLAFDNSHQELERMKVLRKDNNTSERAFQTAEATCLQNQADVSTVYFKIQKNYGGKVADLVGPMVVPPGTERKPNPLLGELGDAREVFLVRVDVPESEVLKAAPAGARIVGLREGALPVRGEFFGEVPTVDPQTQAHGYFFLVSTNQPKLTPGMAVTAFIQTEGQALSGVVVPRDAVVRFNGATWIYLQTGDDKFQREGVAVETPIEGGWFVRDGLKPQDKVVIVGAQQLLSEELKGQIGGD